MGLNPDAVGATSEPVERSWESKDALLYALGVGAGASDPTGFELEFTTENSHGVTQRVLPTFTTIVGLGGGLPAIGDFDPAMLVHGEQAIRLHGELPTAGTVSTVTKVAGMYDKGSAGLVVLESESHDAASGAPAFTTRSSLFIRGAGGFGGPRNPEDDEETELASEPLPEREPDHVVSYPTRSDQALLYRLSGDRNPLHSDPRSPSGPDSTDPSSTACAPTASPAGVSCTSCALRTRRASAACGRDSRSRPCPATPSPSQSCSGSAET